MSTGVSGPWDEMLGLGPDPVAEANAKLIADSLKPKKDPEEEDSGGGDLASMAMMAMLFL
jgi:hypothetical protein